MPADLSLPRLGSRSLDLLDDIANWGHRKYVLGEVDVFRVQPDYELFGHTNIKLPATRSRAALLRRLAEHHGGPA